MFGKNKIVKQNITDGTELNVVEVFPTIQGEGMFAGEPAIFIRLAGCNLQCYFCDTDFETNSTSVNIFDLLATIKELRKEIKTDLIVITGGEPMLQNIAPLISNLINDYRVQVETAGTVWVPGLWDFFVPGMMQRLFIVCSPKTGKVRPEIEHHCRAWKYIIIEGDQSPDDGLPLNSTQHKGKQNALYRPPNDQFRYDKIYLQPCDEQDEVNNDANLSCCITLAKKYGYSVCLQQHKYMGVE